MKQPRGKVQKLKRERRHQVKTMRLGKTGLEVSRVGLGGIPLTRPTEAEAIRMIQRSLDLGVNFIDTSIGYHTSEERIGKAIAGRRDQVIVATKGGSPDKAETLEDINQSLTRLRIDYIDLWQFHGVSSLEAYEKIIGPGGVMEAAQEALQAGKIRHIGISSHNPDLALQVVASGHFETLMFPFNFVAREAADELIPLAKENDVGFIAMKPFGGSMLDNATLAIKYQLQFDNVIPIPGVETVEQIEEIVDIVNGDWRLTPQEAQEIETIRDQMDAQLCRRCCYCQPCPQGVRVQPLMTLPGLWRLWPPDRFFSWQFVKRTVESTANCDNCGECEEKCPYHLPIQEMIAENVAFFERAYQEYQTSIGEV